MKFRGLSGDAGQQLTGRQHRNITAAVHQKKIGAQIELGIGADPHLALAFLKLGFGAVEDEGELLAFHMRLKAAQWFQQVRQSNVVHVAAN